MILKSMEGNEKGKAMINLLKFQLDEKDMDECLYKAFDKNRKRLSGYDFPDYRKMEEMLLRKLNEWREENKDTKIITIQYGTTIFVFYEN
jgi:hypothetical protein